MYELILQNINLQFAHTVLATNYSFDSLLWNFFLVIFIIGGIILSVFLIVFSTKPENWEHESYKEDNFPPGRLDFYANNINFQASEHQDSLPLKNHIEMLFFEKLRSVHGLTQENIYDMKLRNPQALRNLIADDEISSFIFNDKVKSENKGFFNIFKLNKKEKKDKFLLEINKVLDKMEVWGQ